MHIAEGQKEGGVQGSGSRNIEKGVCGRGGGGGCFCKIFGRIPRLEKFTLN